jgi:RIO-like serine/threonine protein kinase
MAILGECSIYQGSIVVLDTYNGKKGAGQSMDIDVKGLDVIGEGRHGKVYRLDEKRCLKVYKKKVYMEMEYKVLKHSERFPYFPRVYECKDNYMIREYFDGPNLRQYIQNNGFSETLAIKLLEVIDSFVELEYSRLDCRLPHIIVIKGECLKIIDPTRNMSKTVNYPCRLLAELDGLGIKNSFLEYTKAFRPDYYAKWKKELN